MKIRQSDDHRLLIIDFPWLLIIVALLPIVFLFYQLALLLVRGAISFDQIRCAMVEDGGDRNYRVTLTIDKGLLPITEVYESGVRDRCEEVRDAINAILSTSAGSEIEARILDLAAAGKKLDAIRLTRERYGCTLSEARRFVEELTTTADPPRLRHGD